MLTQSGHDFLAIPEYTLSQFEAAAELANKLIMMQQARLVSGVFTAQHGTSNDVQKYIENLQHG